MRRSTGKSAKTKFEQIKAHHAEQYKQAQDKALKQLELANMLVDLITLSYQMKPAQTKLFKQFDRYIDRMKQLGRSPTQIAVTAKQWLPLSTIAKSDSLTYKGVPIRKQ